MVSPRVGCAILCSLSWTTLHPPACTVHTVLLNTSQESCFRTHCFHNVVNNRSRLACFILRNSYVTMATEAYDVILTHNPSIRVDYNDPFDNNKIDGWWIFYTVSIACPIAIICGVFSYILALIVLVKGRLWLKHEGYVYLAANFCANVGILLFCTGSYWLTSVFELLHYSPSKTSTFVCIVWRFLMSIFFTSGWLCVALLFTIYLREHLMHRRCGCPLFADKYCTLFASKVIVVIIFSALFGLGMPYLTIFECEVSQSFALSVALIVEAIIMWVLPFVFFLPIVLLLTLCTNRKVNTFGFSQIEERCVSDEQMRIVAIALSTINLSSQFILATVCAMIYVSNNLFLSLREFAIPAHGVAIAIQPIVCFIILKALREGFRSQLRNIRCCRRLFPSLDREEESVRLVPFTRIISTQRRLTCNL